MIRAFVAIELSAGLRALVVRAQEQIKQRLHRSLLSKGQDVRVQWVRPDSIHLTLKFLGDIEEGLVDPIRELLAPVVTGVSPFSVGVERLGVFPDLRNPRVLWLGLSGPVETLVRLAAEADARFHSLGFPLEKRPFDPHLTLARVKERSREVGRAVTESGMMSERLLVGELEVHGVSLMKSELRPAGAVYTKLWDIPLDPSAVPL